MQANQIEKLRESKTEINKKMNKIKIIQIICKDSRF